MFCTGRFYVDDKDYPILKCHLHVPQKPTTKFGMVISECGAPQIHLTIESTSETHLLSWINDQIIKDYVQVRINNHHHLGADKVFDLRDVRCFQNDEYFRSDDTSPMTNVIILVAAIFQYNGDAPIVQHWRIQDPNNSDVTATERPEEGVITDCHFEDSDGNILTKLKANMDIYAVVNSTNMTGDIISLDLSDDEIDYEYNGQYLENDLLENINVTADTIRIPLRTIKQRN